MTAAVPRRSSRPPPPAPAVNFRLELPIEPQWQNVDLLRLAILNCLQTNRNRISTACRQVLASHGQ